MEAALPEYISMYDISGQDKITERSFNRYVKDKEQDQKIKDQIEHSAASYEKKIKSAPRAARSDIIKVGLAKEDVAVQEVCAAMIKHASRFEQAVLREEVSRLIKTGLAEENPVAQKDFARMIMFASRDDQVDLRKEVLRLVKTGLANENPATQKAYAEMIREVPLDARADIIQTGLAKEDVKVQQVCAEMIWSVPDLSAQTSLREKVFELVKAGLDKQDPVAQKAYVKMIWYGPKDARVGFVQAGLAKEDVAVQKACASMIEDLPVGAHAGLQEKVVQLVKAGLETEDQATQQACAEMIQYVPKDAKKSLFLVARKKLGNVLVQPPLYKDQEVSKDAFQRVKFPKTGSETTLIGGRLKDKTIIRHIQPEAFIAWQKLFEDHAVWKREGFDYVPIEPIQSYRINKKGLVDVYSGILDLNLNAWKQMSNDFKDELNADAGKIQAILREQRVEHGHPGDYNFCLRFFRDEKGNVDFSKKPRIYLIDFDRAVTS